MSKRDKCPNCNGKSKTYYCTECIQKGNFYFSGKIPGERYAEKKVVAEQKKFYAATLGEKALSKSAPLVLKREKLLSEIQKLREANELLRNVLDVEKSKYESAKKEAKELETDILRIAYNNKKFRLKNSGLKENTILYTKRIEEKKRMISDMERKRREYIKDPILKNIVQNIFCFKEEKRETSNEDYETPAIRQMMISIDEATHTNYVGGRWVTDPHFSHGKFSLASTILPASGDYIEFARSRSKDEASYKKEADNILAGVSFLNQMVNTVADLVKIPLPKRINMKDIINLTFEDLGKAKFQKIVTRINANVLFLCLSQGVPANSLLPLCPLINLNALFTDPTLDIGRLGSFEIPQSLINLINEFDDEEEFSDSYDSDSGEWNVVNAANVSEIPTISPPRRRVSFDETASSVVTSAAASVLSMFGLGNN